MMDDRGDRTVEVNGGSAASHLARTLSVPVFFLLIFKRSRSKGAFRLPGATWDHFRCMPKGPFHTKNAIAAEIVVFCYRGSISLSVPIRYVQITIAVVNHYRGSKLLSR